MGSSSDPSAPADPLESSFGGTERFEVRRLLGAGGMGVVYEVLDRELGAICALKTLRRQSAHALYRFKEEFRALADIDHPNLVRLGELFFEDGRWFFTMELVEGVDFLEHVGLARDGRLVTRRGDPDADEAAFDEHRLREALRGLAAAVEALHAAGKVHRDVKPSNVLVTPDGRAVLLDFGLVTDAAGVGDPGEIAVGAGTVHYMAPEQAAGAAAGPPADWYAVGTLLYQALTGRLPFPGDPLRILTEKRAREPAPASVIAAGVPEDLDRLCADLLRLDPALRPDGADVLRRLGLEATPVSHATTGSGLPQAPFVGRQRELAELRRAVADSRDHPVTVFVSGVSGVGKSTLTRQLVRELDADGDALVLHGRCYERESVPFKAFDGLVDALARHLRALEPEDVAALTPADVDLLCRVFPVLRRVSAMARVVEPSAVPETPMEARSRAFGALRALLARLSERRPLVALIDDFQWADADSLSLFSDLTHGDGAPRLLLLATLDDPRGRPPPPLRAVVADVRRIELEPLPADDVRALVRLLHGADEPSAAAAIAQESEGHPMFVHELVRHQLALGGAPTTIRLEDTLAARIGRVDPAARHLLDVVSVAGAPLTRSVAAEAAEMTVPEVARWTTLLQTTHLLRSARSRDEEAVEPYHDRVRATVVGLLSRERLVDLHARIADALEVAGAATRDPLRLIGHLEAAGQGERAARHAQRAAQSAMEAMAWNQAADLLGAALSMTAHAEARARELRLLCADALVMSGRGVESARLLLEAAVGADPTTRLDCRRRAATQLLQAGHLEDGLRALEEVLSEIGESLPATPGAALRSIVRNRLRLGLRGMGFTPRDPSEISRRQLIELDVYRAVSAGLGLVDSVRGADFHTRGLLLALDAGEPERLALALIHEALFQAARGRRGQKRARRCLAMIGDIDVALRQGSPGVFADGGVGVVSFFAGEYRDAERRLRETLDFYRARPFNGQTFEYYNAQIFRLIALRHCGDVRELRRAFDEYVRDAIARGDRYSETTLTRALAIVWLLADDPDEAERRVAAAPWLPPEGRYHLQHWYAHLANTQIAIYRGDADAADALVSQTRPGLERSMLMRVVAVRTMYQWLSGRVALLRPGAAGARYAERMARKLDGEGVAAVRVWASLLRAGAAARRAAPERALEHLVAARDAADLHGMAVYSRIASRLIGITGGDEGLAREAERWMVDQTIARPELVTRLYAPGFEEG